jgi:hypothetical protein
MDLLSNLSSTYRQSLIAGEFASISGSGQGGNPTSPYLEMIGSLGALRQNDPILYKRVMREVTTSLQTKIDGFIDTREFVKRHKTTWARSVASRLKYLDLLCGTPASR